MSALPVNVFLGSRMGQVWAVCQSQIPRALALASAGGAVGNCRCVIVHLQGWPVGVTINYGCHFSGSQSIEVLKSLVSMLE